MNHLKKYRSRLIALILLIITFAIAPYVLAATHAPRPMEPLPSAPLIDLHCHTAGLGAGNSGCFVSAELRDSFKLRFYLKSFGVTEAQIRQGGDVVVLRHLSERLARSQHVGRAVILALDGVIDEHGELDREQTEIYVPNEFLAAEIPKFPNLQWGASVNPARPDALARLEWARAHGAVLVKWLPSVQQIDPADPRLIPYYQKLVELDLPLLTHTGNERAFTQARDELCDPQRLRLPLSLGVTVIAAHAGTTGEFDGESCLDRLGTLMREYPTLYADVSSLTQLNKRDHLARVLARPEFRDRLIYGTDYPLIEIHALVSPWYYPDRLTLTQMFTVAKTKNPWDRDVVLKQALGLPADAWTRGESLLPTAGGAR